MRDCPRCKIHIVDDAVMCPLCHGVLRDGKYVVSGQNQGEQEPEQTGAQSVEQIEEADELLGAELPGWESNHASRSVMYPDVEPSVRKVRMAIRISIFGACLAEFICVLVNYLTFTGVRWSIISAIGLFYGCFTLVYSVQRTRSHQRKMIVQLVFGLLVACGIDYALGFQGWSVSFVMPGAIVLMDISLIILMLLNSTQWQNYIMAQAWMIIISGICLIPTFMIPVEFKLFGMLAFVVSIFALAGSYVFGDKSAERELKRRFHV